MLPSANSYTADEVYFIKPLQNVLCSCYSLLAGVIPKQKSKTQTTAVKKPKCQWTWAKAALRRNFYPLCLPGLGSQKKTNKKNHFCLWFVHIIWRTLSLWHNLWLKTSTKIQKFPILEGFSWFGIMTAAMTAHNQTQHQGTALALGILILTCSCTSSAKPTPSQNFILDITCLDTKSHSPSGQTTIFELSTATLTICSCFTVPSLKISPPPPFCPVQLQRCPCQARVPSVCSGQGCFMKRQTFSYHPGFYLIWCFNSSLSPETFCNTAESPWATPGCVQNTKHKHTLSRDSWDAGGKKKTGFHLCMKII